jgi:transcriptional/translational regulatory protein YebC/TACO1
MIPNTQTELHEQDAEKVLNAVEALEELDDVQEVYANFDIPDAVLDAVAESDG